MTKPLTIKQFIGLGLFSMNAYLVNCEKTGVALMIDPGDEPEKLLPALETLPIEEVQIFLTHAHIDHVLAVRAIRKAYHPVKLYLPKADEELYLGLAEQCRRFGLPMVAPESDYSMVEEGAEINVGELQASVLHTPGHTPGSSCLYFAAAKTLFSGDLIFKDAIGRMDLWGGDENQMRKSLRRLLSLPKDITIYPGHGPSTTLGDEIDHNPYLQDWLG